LKRLTLTAFVRRNWPIVAVFTVALATGLWFAVSVGLNLLYFNDPRHQDVDLKPWMTPRYVVMSYDLPRGVVADVLDLSEEDQRGERLDVVANRLGITLDELTERVRDAAEDYREDRE